MGIDQRLCKNPVNNDQRGDQGACQILARRNGIKGPVDSDHHQGNQDQAVIFNDLANPVVFEHRAVSVPALNVATILHRLLPTRRPLIIMFLPDK